MSSRILPLKFNSARCIEISGGIFCFAVFYLLILFDFKPSLRVPGKNETASFDIVSPRDCTFEDKKATERFISEEMSKVENQYRKDYTVDLRIEHKLKEIEKLVSTKSFKTLLKDYQIDHTQIENLTNQDLSSGISEIRKFLKEKLRTGIREDVRLDEFMKDVPDRISNTRSLLLIMEKVFEPNLLLDQEKIRTLREEAAAKVIPVFIKISKGQIIVRNGDKPTDQEVRIMALLGFYEHERGTLKQKIGVLIFLLTLALTGYYYLVRFENSLLQEKHPVWLVLTIMIISMSFMKLFKGMLDYDIKMENILGNTSVFSPAAFPLALSAIIITVLADGRIAILTSVFLSVISIYQLGIKYYYVFYFLLGCFAAIFASQKVSKTTELSKNGLIISLVNMVVILSLYLIFENPVYHDQQYWVMVGRDMIWGFFSGIFSVALAIGFLPYFESLFRLSSSIRLLELADLNQTLLKTMMMEAPGTYQHSIVVGNLAQAAAQELGADPLMAKIGGYYHDIGKLKRPQLFIENQAASSNRHNGLTPNLSALIISSHVKDGVETAKKHGLPDEICDIIAQHHGTTLIQYFYHAARMEQKEDQGEVPIEQFRYPGPLPSTKEAAVVMLADSVESATRSLDLPNASNIEAIVKKIINDKFVEGQFNECDLTLKDIEGIAKIFIKMLISMYHSRIKYPDQDRELKSMTESLNEN